MTALDKAARLLDVERIECTGERYAVLDEDGWKPGDGMSDDDLCGALLDALAEKRMYPAIEYHAGDWLAMAILSDHSLRSARGLTRLAAVLALVDALPDAPP